MNPNPKASLPLLMMALLSAGPASANVIFPAFAAPYVVTVFVPLLVLAVVLTETLVLYFRERSAGFGNALLWVSLANIASWVVGVVLSATLLPSGLVAGNPGPLFETLMWIAIPVALVLSVLIEAGVLLLLARKHIARSPWITMAIANVASYLIVTVVFLWGADSEPMTVKTPELPAQAILHDKDTWTDAVGVSLEGH